MKYFAAVLLACVTIVSIMAFDDSEIKSFRGGDGGKGDVVEQMYGDLLDKNSELAKLDKEINSNNKEWNDIQLKFTAYKNASSGYYTTAVSKANEIKDPELAKNVKKLLGDSQAAYEKSLTQINDWTAKVKAKEVTMDDYQTALKIGLTLTTLEKYQKENMPSSTEYQAMLKKMEESIQKLQQRLQ